MPLLLNTVTLMQPGELIPGIKENGLLAKPTHEIRYDLLLPCHYRERVIECAAIINKSLQQLA